MFDNDASLCGSNGASACTGTKLELGAEKVALVPKDSATFIFLTNVNGGTWVLMSSSTEAYESVQNEDIADNIGLQDTEDSIMLQVLVNQINVGDDDAFTLQRAVRTSFGTGPSPVPATDFQIKGQNAIDSATNTGENDDNGGLVTITAGAAINNGAGGAMSIIGGAAPGSGAGGAIVIESGTGGSGGSHGTVTVKAGDQ
eukprot:COSAG02_NODE_2843_length_7905_cov_95.905842_1_plen_199_part_10